MFLLMLRKNFKMLKKSYLVIYILFLSCFNNSSKLELETISNVNLNKFMGNWYVIACIPTILEKNIVNAIENYSLNENNEIETTFSFRKKSVLNPIKTYKSKAIILNEKNNSEWEMHFLGGLFNFLCVALPSQSLFVCFCDERSFVRKENVREKQTVNSTSLHSAKN